MTQETAAREDVSRHLAHTTRTAHRHDRPIGSEHVDENGYRGIRRVIDVSGDGVNNSGPPAEEARDRAVADGIVINGLPIMNDRPAYGRMPPLPLDQYYAQNVIGGPGAFLISAADFDAFENAVRRKLVREVAGLDGPRMMRG